MKKKIRKIGNGDNIKMQQIKNKRIVIFLEYSVPRKESVLKQTIVYV